MTTQSARGAAGRYGRAVATRRSPRVPASLDSLLDPTIEPDTRWEEQAVSGQATVDDAEGLEVLRSRCAGLTLTGHRLDGSRWRDVSLQLTEMSGATFEAAVLVRVDVDDSRLSGAVFAGAKLTDVRFHRCRIDLASFRMAVLERVEFDECDLRGADFHAATLPEAVFRDCDLTGAEFSQATMSGVRLHGSVVDDLHGGRALSGVSIGAGQVLPMALNVFAALGITVTDED